MPFLGNLPQLRTIQLELDLGSSGLGRNPVPAGLLSRRPILATGKVASAHDF